MSKEIYNSQNMKDREERINSWKTAIGLQAVDGLKPSDYLYELAGKHIEGNIDIKEVKVFISSYYENKEGKKEETDTDEADKVAANIIEILEDEKFCLCAEELKNIHESLFYNVLPNAGDYRTHNFIKREWVLQLDSVSYGDYHTIMQDLDKEIEKERNFNYQQFGDKQLQHFADFIADIWKIHPFSEGNTRTTAIFAIKYLKTIGKEVNNELFRNNSWFFRNALARANYANERIDVKEDRSFLYKFFGNLLNNENNELRNRDMLILPPEGWNKKKETEESIKIEKNKKMNSISNAIIYKQEGTVDVIKCSINGQEQEAKVLKTADLMKYYSIRKSGNKKEEDLFLMKLASNYYLGEDIKIITDITVIGQKTGNLQIRCKVDGIQQCAKPMTTEDIKEYDRLKKEGNEEDLKKFLENTAQKHFTGTQTKSQGLKR